METLTELVDEVGARYDKRPALLIRPSFRTRTMRYRDLRSTVPRAARVLVEAGVTPGDRVLVWSVNRPEWGLAFFAISHAGAVSVPLDVRHPAEFARKIVEQTAAVLVVASRQTEAAARQLGLPVVMVETLPDHARRAEPLPGGRRSLRTTSPRSSSPAGRPASPRAPCSPTATCSPAPAG